MFKAIRKLLHPKPKRYEVTSVIYNDGEPERKLRVYVTARTRKEAMKIADERLEVKAAKAHVCKK